MAMMCLCCRSGSRASHHQHVLQMQPVTSVVEVTAPMEPLDIAGEDGVSSTWQPDPNEPRYCLCNDVSYGDMVGCDNEDVSIFVLVLVLVSFSALFCLVTC